MKILRISLAFLLLPALCLPLQADTLTSKASVAVQAVFAKSNALSNPRDVLSKTIQKEFANGTSSGQADRIFRDQRTLTDGSTENLDLAGVLTDPFGTTLTFAKVKVLMIENLSTTQTLTVGGAASNQFVNWVGAGTHTVIIPPGGFFAISAPAAGFAVTASTGDLLKVANSAGASCIYNVVILGTSS
jgi:hypothetical protein